MSRPPGPKFGPDYNPGNTRYCEEHKRLECDKRRSKGRGICHAPAIHGTDTCRIHAGHSTAVAVAKGQARINAWSALGQPADGTAIDSGAAVLGMLQQSWLRANLYGQLLRAQVTKDGDGDALGENQFDPERPVEAGGLIGFRYGAAGKDGHIYAVSEEARALVALESAERDRVVKYAKTAHDMGISERMIGMAERWGDQVVNRIMVILAGLALTAEQEAMVPALIQANLGSIELGT